MANGVIRNNHPIWHDRIRIGYNPEGGAKTVTVNNFQDGFLHIARDTRINCLFAIFKNGARLISDLGSVTGQVTASVSDGVLMISNSTSFEVHAYLYC